jgi:hypothetical protein
MSEVISSEPGNGHESENRTGLSASAEVPTPLNPPRYVADYWSLSEGDTDPSLNKKIKTLIMKEKSFIVYLDDALCVQWTVNAGYRNERFAKDFGTVINRVGQLESLSTDLLSRPQLVIIRRLLGEGVARLLDDSSSANAMSILDQADKYLRDRSVERGRIWYISSAAVTTALIMLSTILLWAFRGGLQPNIGHTALETSLGAGVGSLGAFISILLRVNKLNIDSLAGKTVHLFEGAVRIITGTTGALLVALAVKSDLVLGALNGQEKTLSLLAAICIVAGASERILPNLIKNVEGTVLGDSSAKDS